MTIMIASTMMHVKRPFCDDCNNLLTFFMTVDMLSVAESILLSKSLIMMFCSSISVVIAWLTPVSETSARERHEANRVWLVMFTISWLPLMLFNTSDMLANTLFC